MWKYLIMNFVFIDLWVLSSYDKPCWHLQKTTYLSSLLKKNNSFLCYLEMSFVLFTFASGVFKEACIGEIRNRA